MANDAGINKTIARRQRRDKDAVVKCLRERPIVGIACKRAGIVRATYYRWYKEDSNFAREVDGALYEGRDLVNDMAESSLMSGIQEKKHASTVFWLIHNHSRYMPTPKTRELSIREQRTQNMVEQQRFVPGDEFEFEKKQLAHEYEEKLREIIGKEIKKKFPK